MEDGAVGHNFEKDHPRTIPARVSLIWLSGFRGDTLNVMVYNGRLYTGVLDTALCDEVCQ